MSPSRNRLRPLNSASKKAPNISNSNSSAEMREWTVSKKKARSTNRRKARTKKRVAMKKRSAPGNTTTARTYKCLRVKITRANIGTREVPAVPALVEKWVADLAKKALPPLKEAKKAAEVSSRNFRGNPGLRDLQELSLTLTPTSSASMRKIPCFTSISWIMRILNQKSSLSNFSYLKMRTFNSLKKVLFLFSELLNTMQLSGRL